MKTKAEKQEINLLNVQEEQFYFRAHHIRHTGVLLRRLPDKKAD